MSRLSDRLFEIELDLAKNEGDDENAALSRRMVLREAFTAWGDERWKEGYHDGRRDISRRMVLREAFTAWGDERWKEGYHDGRRDILDARSEAQRRADAAEAGAS